MGHLITRTGLTLLRCVLSVPRPSSRARPRHDPRARAVSAVGRRRAARRLTRNGARPALLNCYLANSSPRLLAGFCVGTALARVAGAVVKMSCSLRTLAPLRRNLGGILWTESDRWRCRAARNRPDQLVCRAGGRRGLATCRLTGTRRLTLARRPARYRARGSSVCRRSRERMRSPPALSYRSRRLSARPTACNVVLHHSTRTARLRGPRGSFTGQARFSCPRPRASGSALAWSSSD